MCVYVQEIVVEIVTIATLAKARVVVDMKPMPNWDAARPLAEL